MAKYNHEIEISSLNTDPQFQTEADIEIRHFRQTGRLCNQQ